MPNRTIYIRVEDLAAWAQIPDKPQWLHTALNGRPLENVIKTVAFCQHGAAKGFCKFGCK